MQGRYCATRVYLWSVGKNSTRLHIVSVTSPKSPDLHSAFESDEIFRKNTFLENDVPCFASMTMRMHTELHVKTRGLLFCDRSHKIVWACQRRYLFITGNYVICPFLALSCRISFISCMAIKLLECGYMYVDH